MITIPRAKTKTSIIGIDWGATELRAAQVTRRGGQWHVSSLARRSRSEAGQEEADGALPRAWFRDLLAQGTFRGRRVAVALSPPDVEFQTLELPKAVLADRANELEQAVRWEMQRLTTQPDTAAETCHWLLPTTHAGVPNAIGIATSSQTVERVLATSAHAFLRCSCVDAAAIALARVGSVLLHPDDRDVWSILDAGHRQTRLIVCVEDIPVLMRTVGSGQQAWVERIAESLQISAKAAQLHLREHGIALAARGVRHDDGHAPGAKLGAMLYGILRSDLTAIASEIKRSYEYVMSCYPGRRAGDLTLVGSGAIIRNLPEFLAGALGISAKAASSYLAEDTCQLSCPPRGKHAVELFALAIGTAMGE